MQSILTQTNRNEKTTSDKYKVITTGELMAHFESLGFEQTQLVGTSEFGKHLVRLRDTRNLVPIDGGHLELIIFNSYDGSSSLRLSLGVHRLVCSNGMISKTRDLGDVRIRHTGDVKAKITKAVARIRSNYTALAEQVEKLKSIDTNDGLLYDRIYPIVQEELSIRTKGDCDLASFINIPIKRKEDNATDLWTVLNVIQEGFIRGGISYTNQDGKKKTLKAITSPTRNIKINQRLWEAVSKIADEVA